MSQRFVRYHPVVRRDQRERLMFIVAASVAFGLLCSMILVINSRSSEASIPVEKKQIPVEPVRPTIGTVTLLAPERSVPAGTKLSTVPLKEVYWPRNQVPERAIRDAAEVKSQYAKSLLPAGLPLIRDNLTSTPTDGPLPLKAGYRAISIEVSATGGLEGHALPGTRVDVLLTYVKDGEKTTKIIVQNARVLSYGGSVDAEPAQQTQVAGRNYSRRQPSTTITLETLPADALKIQTATSMGKLGLMMRSQEETNAAPEATEMNENGVSGDRALKSVREDNRCSKGSIKVSGKEFSVGCDGQIAEVIDPTEP